MATDKLVDFDHVTDYISREAAIKEFCDDCMDREWCKSNGYSCSRIKNINAVPAADVRPVARGHWIEHISDLFPADSTIECDQCHAEQPTGIDDNFCPNCGADMREADADGESRWPVAEFLHFQTKIKYTEDQNIKVQLENVTDHDLAEVVRCKDCKYYKEGKLLGPTKFCYYYQIGTGLNTAENDFCSKGERRAAQ